MLCISSSVEFEWDAVKAPRNRRRHGVVFGEAAETFLDPLAAVSLDVEHSDGEQRLMLLGRSLRGRLLVTVFTEREDRIRIISSRPANRREVKGYEEGV